MTPTPLDTRMKEIWKKSAFMPIAPVVSPSQDDLLWLLDQLERHRRAIHVAKHQLHRAALELEEDYFENHDMVAANSSYALAEIEKILEEK